VPDSAMQIADAALFISKSEPALGIKDPYELTQKQFDAVIAMLKKQKPLVRQYWSIPSEEISLFQNGQVFVGAASTYQAVQLKTAGASVSETVPAEGATGWADTWMLATKAPHPNCAYMWTKWVSTPKVQAQQALLFGETPVNTKACAEIKERGFATDGGEFHEELRCVAAPIRDQEGEQAQIAAHEEIEKSRFIQERNLAEVRIQNQEDTQHREIARRRAIDEAEMKSREKTEHEQIALDLALEKARINREREQSELEVTRRRALELADIERQIALASKSVELTKAEADKRRSEIVFNQEIETSRIAQDQALDLVRMERERALDALQIAKRQAFEEAEIASGEEIERSRIATERGLGAARLARDSDLRQLAVERDKTIEMAEMQKAIEVAKKSAERSAAVAASEIARAKAVEAEEQTFTVREREIAERRKLTDLIGAKRENEREALRLTSKADAEKAAATSFAEAIRIAAQGEAAADKIKVLAAAARYEVDAKGRTQLNEAENLLSDASRTSRFREKLLERIEGIVRESVRPMEKIDGIKILHIDGTNGAGGGHRNVTDEVIDSALRYRVQAPMIDSLMKEIGIEGGSLGRMTEVLRDAKDIESLTSKRAKAGVQPAARPEDDRDDDRNR